jgi:hypothetical protein
MEKFLLGLAVGMAGGALIVANNCKIRNLVKKNQDEIMTKAEQYIDSKMGSSSSTSSDEESGSQQ